MLFHLVLNDKNIKTKVLFLFLVILLPYKLAAQEKTIISGLENLHLSEGATMVTVEKEDTTVNYITASHSHKSTIKSTPSPSKEMKEKTAFAQKKKTPKAIDEKLIKKMAQKREVKIVYNTDAQSEENLSSNFGTSKSGINNQNQSQKLDKALFTENKLLVFLFIYQEKQNVLFQFYHSLKVENHLFTRPPPTFI